MGKLSNFNTWLFNSVSVKALLFISRSSWKSGCDERKTIRMSKLSSYIDFKDRSLSSTRGVGGWGGVGWRILVVSLSLPSPPHGLLLARQFSLVTLLWQDMLFGIAVLTKSGHHKAMEWGSPSIISWFLHQHSFHWSRILGNDGFKTPHLQGVQVTILLFQA